MMTQETVQEVIKNIKKALDEVVANLRDKGVGNRKWTHDCLMRLALLGKDNGYGVCPYPESMRGEWLYDLIWYSEEESEWPKRLKNVVLVLESEWSTSLGEIRYDFQKLVQAKSWLKVLVCQDLNEEMMKELIADIEAFESKTMSEIYLFASYDNAEGMFKYKTYQVGKGLENVGD